MRVAVTGAAGFIGGRLVGALRERGVDLVALGAASSPGADLGAAGAELVPLLAGVETVVHLAGANEVVMRRDPPGAAARTIAAARSVAAAAVAAGARRVVYVSTVHVYGSPLTPGEVVTERSPTRPVGAYAETRLAVEELLGGLSLEVVVFRLTNAVGPPAHPDIDRWTLVAADLCRQAVVTGRMVLQTPGTQWRDFVALGDVLAILADSLGPTLPAGTYNLASSRQATILGLAEAVRAEAARQGQAVELLAPAADSPPDEPPRVAVDKLAAAGWSAPTPLPEMVAELFAYCLRHRAVLARLSPPAQA